MYYILNKNFAIKSYKDKPYCLYKRFSYQVQEIEKEFYELLEQCDGKHQLKVMQMQPLVEQGVVKPCEYGEFELTDWQNTKSENIYLHEIELSLTYKCNMNCLHCFTTSKVSHLMAEMSLEQVDKLLDEAVQCGVLSIMLTGGEPMCHPQFREVIKLIYEKGLYLTTIVTNGTYIDRDFLDYLMEFPNSDDMEFDISFDCIGTHDWLRNREGAEKQAREAIKLCCDNGFRVMANINTNKKTVETLHETIEMLEELGVSISRIISTRRSPKWIEVAGGMEYDWVEWYDLAVEFMAWYTSKPHKMTIDFWATLSIDPINHTVGCNSIRGCSYDCNESQPLCGLIRRRIAICPDGEINICHQMTGALRKDGRSLGNVISQGLVSVLKESEYQEIVEAGVAIRKEHNEECASCEFWNYCVGGCPVMAHEWHKEYVESPFPYWYDMSKCIFFKKGYFHKIASKVPMDYTFNKR